MLKERPKVGEMIAQHIAKQCESCCETEARGDEHEKPE